MSMLTAIDWDRREARVMTATLRRRTLHIEQVFAVAWSSDEADVVQRTEALKTELRKRGIGRGDVLVAISRGAVELKQLELPPAPDDDLPDLVRFQALRELHAVTDVSPLDFTTTPAEEGRPRSVLAAAVDPGYLSSIQAICEGAGLRVRRVLLRPCETASLVTRRFSTEGNPLRLTIDAGREEAEFIATVGHDVVLLRAARLSGDFDSAEYARSLASELRRTLAAVQHQSGGRRVETIALCGAQSEFAATMQGLTQGVDLPIEIVDPAELLAGIGYETMATGETQTRLAPLVGALLDEAEGIAPAFDFLHPRKRRPPPNMRKRLLVGGLAAATIAALGFFTVQSQLSALDRELETLRDQAKALAPAVAEAEEIQKRAGEVEKWLRTDVLWLEELARLAQQLPPAQEVMLTQLRLAAHPQGGELQLTGVLAESSAGDDLEAALRDERHTVEGRGRRHDPKDSRYPWRFQSTVVVKAPPSEFAPPAKALPGGGAR